MRKKVSVIAKKQVRLWAVNKIAAHFGLPRKLVLSCCNTDEEIIRINDAEGRIDFDTAIYATKVDNIQLETFWEYKRFVASEFYDQYLEGEALSDAIDFVMVVSLNNYVFAIYKDFNYEGIGGSFVRDPDKPRAQGFVIEPFVHYLKKHHPPPENN